MGGELAAVVDALDAAGAMREWALDDADIIAGLDLLQRLEQQVAALKLRLVGEFDARAGQFGGGLECDGVAARSVSDVRAGRGADGPVGPGAAG